MVLARTSTLPLGHRVSSLAVSERARYLSVTGSPPGSMRTSTLPLGHRGFPGCVRASTLPLGHRGSPWLCENEHATTRSHGLPLAVLERACYLLVTCASPLTVWELVRYDFVTEASPGYERRGTLPLGHRTAPSCVWSSSLPLAHRGSPWLYENGYATSGSQGLPLAVWERAHYFLVTGSPHNTESLAVRDRARYLLVTEASHTVMALQSFFDNSIPNQRTNPPWQATAFITAPEPPPFFWSMIYSETVKK